VSSLRDLNRIYDDSAAYIALLRERRAMDGSDDVSPFWAEVLAESKRRSHPTFSEMLVMRRGFTYPLGDRAKAGDGDADRAYARSAHWVASRSMDPDVLAGFDESAIGAPPVEVFGEQALSGGGIVNALTVHRIERALKERGLSRPLRVLEIGAGYGAVADQLLRRIDIAHYVICDLPENLFLSGYYVPANHPDRTVAFLAPDVVAPADLAFVAPPWLDVAAGPFDLIVNSYSFQEMNRSSVERYLQFAADNLAADGVLFSLNAHGKAGIEAAGQYLVDGLRLHAIAPVRRFPWQVFGTNPYELVLGRSDRPRDSGQSIAVDHIGRLMQVGLHDELAPLCAAAVAGRSADNPDAVGAYVAALVAFSSGGTDPRPILAARADLGDGHAAVIAELVAATLAFERADAAALERHSAAAAVTAPHLGAEVTMLARDPDAVRALVASRLDRETPPPPSEWRRRVTAVERQARLVLASRTRR